MRGGAVPLAATFGVGEHLPEERRRIGGDDRAGGGPDGGAQFIVARDRAGVEHRGPDVEPLRRGGRGFLGRSHGMPDREPRVPQRIQEGVGEAGDLVGADAVVHEEQVDVRPRQLQSPPVAPERHE